MFKLLKIEDGTLRIPFLEAGESTSIVNVRKISRRVPGNW